MFFFFQFILPREMMVRSILRADFISLCAGIWPETIVPPRAPPPRETPPR